MADARTVVEEPGFFSSIMVIYDILYPREGEFELFCKEL
jgi:hypothetical protein